MDRPDPGGGPMIYDDFAAIPTDHYRFVVADPPWAYNNVRTGGSMSSGSAQHYPVMTPDLVADLPVRDLTASGSVLFLWVPTPLLPEGFKVLERWGFSYRTSLYWVKRGRLGLGYWFRGNVEQCLVGIQGKVKAFRCQEPNVFYAKPRAHSQKPVEFWELVERVTDTPRIELFARASRDGWDSFGNEVDTYEAITS